MEKPLTIKRSEFMQMIGNAITAVELPPFIIADCLQITLSQVKELAKEQLAKDLEEYKKESGENE